MKPGWTDFALIAHWSPNSDGVLKFYVNGVGYEYDGPNMVYDLNPSYATERAYYIKQGYYRTTNISEMSSFYETPVLISFPQANQGDFTSARLRRT